MDSSDLFYLTLYIIGVSYILNLMIDDIADKVKFIFEKAVMEDQLKQEELESDVGISFKLSPSYELAELKELSVSVENKSQNLAVYIDWDNCSFVVEHNKQSRRVIRKSPDVTRDLAVPQSPSLVAPTKTLGASVSAEDVYQIDKDSGIYSPSKALVDIAGLEKSPLKPMRKLYKDFMIRRKELKFSLQLVLRISELRVGLTPGREIPPVCIINCPFTIRKLPWWYALPWNKKK
jgi:hypothetical protein